MRYEARGAVPNLPSGTTTLCYSGQELLTVEKLSVGKKHRAQKESSSAKMRFDSPM